MKTLKIKKLDTYIMVALALLPFGLSLFSVINNKSNSTEDLNIDNEFEIYKYNYNGTIDSTIDLTLEENQIEDLGLEGKAVRFRIDKDKLLDQFDSMDPDDFHGYHYADFEILDFGNPLYCSLFEEPISLGSNGGTLHLMIEFDFEGAYRYRRVYLSTYENPIYTFNYNQSAGYIDFSSCFNTIFTKFLNNCYFDTYYDYEPSYLYDLLYGVRYLQPSYRDFIYGYDSWEETSSNITTYFESLLTPFRETPLFYDIYSFCCDNIIETYDSVIFNCSYSYFAYLIILYLLYLFFSLFIFICKWCIELLNKPFISKGD